MSKELIEMLILAAIAGVVVARFYAVLGRKTGSERPTAPNRPGQQRPIEAPAQRTTTPPPGAPPAEPRQAQGFDDILQADPAFDPSSFLAGARGAYEMIVQAFARGDKATLRSMLTPRVFASYDRAIDDRAANGSAAPELVRLKNAEILNSAMAGETARVAVRFEAELAEGAHGLRETRERWTFERDIRSRDPNWLLAGVAQA